MRVKTGCGWLLVALLLVLAWVHDASAQKGDMPCPYPYYLPGTKSYYPGVSMAVVCLTNKTHDRLNYSIRWGDEPWVDFSIDPGQSWSFYWKYDQAAVARGDYRHPMLLAKFDSDLSAGVYHVTINLKTYVTQKADCGESNKHYEFRYSDASRKWLRLEELFK